MHVILLSKYPSFSPLVSLLTPLHRFLNQFRIPSGCFPANSIRMVTLVVPEAWGRGVDMGVGGGLLVEGAREMVVVV